MDISAVILSFNSIKYIEKCLVELFDSYAELSIIGEVHVVDNGSIDGSLAVLTSLKKIYGDALNVIKLGKNTGTTYSRNQALKVSKGERILIMDSDAYMNTSALKGMISKLDNNGEVGLVVPKLIYPDGRPQISVDKFPTLTHKLKRFFFLKSMETNSTNDETEGYVDTAISATWLLSKQTIEKVGFLDEKIFYSPEDIDYCLRIWKAGYKILHVPQYSVVHDAQELSRGFKINKFTFLHAKGLFYFFFKHGYMFGLNRLYSRLGMK